MIKRVKLFKSVSVFFETVSILEVFFKAFRRMDLTFEYLPPRPLLDAQEGTNLAPSSSTEKTDTTTIAELKTDEIQIAEGTENQ